MAGHSVQVEYMHICDYAFPAQGGKPCIIGIFDRITASKFPNVHPVMTVAAQLRGQQGHKLAVQISMVDPKNKPLFTVNAGLSFGQNGAAFLHFQMVQLGFPMSGNYTVNIISEGMALASQTLKLVQGHGAQAA